MLSKSSLELIRLGRISQVLIYEGTETAVRVIFGRIRHILSVRVDGLVQGTARPVPRRTLQCRQDAVQPLRLALAIPCICAGSPKSHCRYSISGKKYQLSNNGIRRSRNTFMYINRWYYFDERHHQLVPVHQQAQGYRVQGVHGLPCHFNLPAVWERVLDVQDVHGWSRDG